MTQGPDVLCAEGVREQCSGWAGEITEDFVNPGGANSHCHSLLLHRDSPFPSGGGSFSCRLLRGGEHCPGLFLEAGGEDP